MFRFQSAQLLRLMAGAAFFAFLSACGEASEKTADDANTGPAIADAEEAERVGALADMAVGPDDAPVTVIEYASITCPHCATFHEDVYPTIKKDYVDTGKVRFVFREFPTAPANLAVAGSMLARCTADKGDQTNYFVLLDALFKTQMTWMRSDSPRDELLKIAGQAGMDETAFDACLNRSELVDLINENVQDARSRYDIASTPSFVINGVVRRPSTSRPEEFAKILDEALEEAGISEQ
ncbi:MAG: DsbA family protein [Pseudomonadota bacterium]